MVVEYVTLMVLLARTSRDFEGLWNTTGGENDLAPNKALSPVQDIIEDGSYMSSMVDQWAMMEFEEVSVLGMNKLGDVLWTTVFNATGTTFDMTSWLSNDTMLSSSAVSTDAQLVITRADYYALRLQPVYDPGRAWFTITAHSLPTYGSLPVFYAAKSPSIPFMFPELPRGHLGCWDTSMFNLNYTLAYDRTALGDNTPDLCIAACDGYNAAILLSAHQCYCGSYDVAGTDTAGLCVHGCPGDLTRLCGGYMAMYGSVYHIQGKSTPGEMMTEQFYLGTHPATGTTVQLNWFDLVATQPDPCVYVTAVTVSSPDTATFSFTYSRADCTVAAANNTRLYMNGSDAEFPMGTDQLEVGILCLKCITFNFSDALVDVTIALHGPTDSMEHIEVPVVAVQAMRTFDDTTTSTSTSTTSTSSTSSSTSTTTSTSSTTSTTTTSTTSSTTSTTSTTSTPTTTTTTPTTSITTTTETPSTTSTSTSTTPTSTTPTSTISTHSLTTTSPMTPTTTSLTTQPSTSTGSVFTPTSTTPITSTTTSAASTNAPTILEPTTTEIVTEENPQTTQAPVTTTKPVCRCPCFNFSQSLNLTAAELQERVLSIQRRLAVNVSELSSTIRKLTSAEDNRPSAVSIGFVGVSLLVGTFGTIFLVDATTLFKDLGKLVANLKSLLWQREVAPV